jgi:hypothetical protein
MIIKFTLFSLIVLLVIVITASYYSNKEGFEDISNGYYKKLTSDLSAAVNTVAPDLTSQVPSSSNSIKDSGPAIVIPATGTPVIPATGTPVTPSGTATLDPGAITPQRTDIIPQISISGSGYNAMTLQQRMDLLKDVQKAVRNELLSNRSTMPILSGETRKSKDTDSTAQGKEYENSCHKDSEYRCPKNPDGSCPPIPDMSEYIRKDSIPCYGCSLDY